MQRANWNGSDFVIINCKNWTSSNKFFRGSCSLGMFKGTPSFGECVDLCIHCQTKRPELDEYIKTLDGKKDEPGKPCNDCGHIKNIVKGFGRLTWERITRGKPDEETIRRSEICAKCEFRTFLNYAEWSVDAGIEIVKTKLLGMQKKDLPINHEPREWDALWCAKCYCNIEAAIRSPDKQCSIGKWLKPESTKPADGQTGIGGPLVES